MPHKIFTARNSSWGKAMFSQVSVYLFTRECVSLVPDPFCRVSLVPYPFWGLSLVPGPFLWLGFSRTRSFLGVGMCGTRSFLGVGMSRGMSKGWVCPGGMHMVGMSPWTWDLGYNGIWLASRQYASYWNAFLLAMHVLCTNHTQSTKH